jgi:multidrug efflux pump
MEAIREASLTRLRPVLMTSAATVRAFPGPGDGPRLGGPNSIAGIVLVTGMTLGTIFTLFVVPVFYALIAEQHRPSEIDESESLSFGATAVEEVAHA